MRVIKITAEDIHEARDYFSPEKYDSIPRVEIDDSHGMSFCSDGEIQIALRLKIARIEDRLNALENGLAKT